MELKITADKVRAAAAKCSTAKQTLETLFPEAFEEDKYYDLSKNYFKDSKSHKELFQTADIQILIADGLAPQELKMKCFYLSSSCNWEVKQIDGNTFLIPTRKKQ